MASRSAVEEIVDESTSMLPAAGQRDIEKSRVSKDILVNYTFPVPNFAKSRMDKKKRLMPQVIAHRGYKAKFPENSLLAFHVAIQAGATALETDIHLTKDNVVVLSHDADLKKFGHSRKILDCTWDEIKHMKTLAQPHVPMVRLTNLLEFILQPGQRDIWLLLDVKPDNHAVNAMRVTASTIAGVRPLSDKPWSQRILFGVWSSGYLPLAAKFLPKFPVVYTGFHLSHARHNLGFPHVGSNMLVQTWLAPGGRRLLQECQTRPGTNIAWTVNDRDKAQWCARRGVDGMITDDPAALVKILELYDERAEESMMPISFSACFDVAIIFLLVNCFFWYFRRVMKLDYGDVRRTSGR